MGCNKKSNVLIVCLILLATSCGGGGGGSSNNVDDTDSNTTAATFTEVNQIISANCLSCHGATPANSAPMSLTTFSQISFFADSIALRINKSESDSLFMPVNGPKLSASDIAKIESWITAGKPNN